MKPIFSLCFVAAVLLSSGCWSFKGISIDPSTKTFYVESFQVAAPNAKPNYEQEFTERLKDKVRTEASLSLTDTDPHVEFTGTITEYLVTNEAPEEDQGTSFGRLTVSMDVDFIDNLDEEKSWKKSYSFFANFDQGEDFSSVENRLLEEINDNLVEQIFNDAFTQW